ncbi:META domain-containing protein [Vibrio ostreicida]|uniref:META domain-containing protein n=1 Tax=Vibrio ostreicida TaxID=526588 RepID=A0ABT8BTN6_9VIBR|nr:META domain-containing protein [Vibrio ostreicida]MDN3609734.1 META domain-containing protein [Vibrio ostreicida]NPD09436.1 META domain-containing protein [Vibrio ostreicida]
MKSKSQTMLLALSLSVLVTACANNQHSQTVASQDLQHHSWELVSMDGKTLALEQHQKRPTLEVGETLMTNGSAGCNNFFGQAELKNNQFRIDKMGMTMKMCMGDAMTLERTFSQSLSEWSNITLDDNFMILTNETHTLTFRLNDQK